MLGHPFTIHPTLAPMPFTFDFELPTSTTGLFSSSFTTTTTSSDPFLPSRVCSALTVRSRAPGHVQRHSQNDVPAIPARAAITTEGQGASARRGGNAFSRRALVSAVSEHRAGTSGVHYSSLPTMPPKSLSRRRPATPPPQTRT